MNLNVYCVRLYQYNLSCHAFTTFNWTSNYNVKCSIAHNIRILHILVFISITPLQDDCVINGFQSFKKEKKNRFVHIAFLSFTLWVTSNVKCSIAHNIRILHILVFISITPLQDDCVINGFQSFKKEKKTDLYILRSCLLHYE